MSRLKSVDPKTVENNETKTSFDKIEKQMGRIPNIFLTMGNSPAALKAYINLSEAVNETSLSPKLRELIALTVGQANGCEYCLSAHTAISSTLKIPDQEVIMARRGEAQDPKTKAILHFVKEAVEKRGRISSNQFDQLKKAGVSDQEVAEIVTALTLNMFTNYFNLITDTTVDFPNAPKLEMAGAR